jgi:cell division septation protein DedD
MASDDQAGREGQCPACGEVVTIPQEGNVERKESEQTPPPEQMVESEPTEEAPVGIDDLSDLGDEGEAEYEKRGWFRSSRFTVLGSIIVVVVVALVVFWVVKREQEKSEEVVAVKEIQPLVKPEEETYAPPVGALLEEQETPQLTEPEFGFPETSEEESLEGATDEPITVEEQEAVPEEPEETVVASKPLETPQVETPPAGTLLTPGAYTINTASFRDKENADRYVEELKELGIDAFNWEIDLGEKGKWHRVSVGGFTTREEAQDYADELKQKGISNTFVTRVPGVS